MRRSPSPSLPPGSHAPAVVQLAQLARDPHAYLTRLKAEYGAQFTMRLPGQPPMVVFTEPADVRTLTTAGYDVLTRAADGIRFILGDHAVILQQDAKHKETRRLLVPPFVGERMRAYGGAMAEIADATIDRWRDGEVRLFHQEMQDVALRVILRCVFGIDDGPRQRRLGRLIVDYLDAMMSPWMYGATLLLSGARVRDFLRARGRHMTATGAPSAWPIQSIADQLGAIDAILFDEIAACRRLSLEALAERSDILAMLVAARYDDGNVLPAEVLRDHLMTLLVGGHETTATALTWAVDCALRHPGTIERMRGEVADVLGSDGLADPSRIKQLGYVGAVINESMRLYPIAWAVPRALVVDTELGGQRLAAGTMVGPSIFHTQRDARHWPEPERFRPERFLEAKASIQTFFPFGVGPWRCLGAQFAEYEMRVVLARLVSAVDLELASDVPARPVMRGLTIAPAGGLPVRVRRRAQKQQQAAATR
jgi:cytochrome P450